ncbi:MAG: M23 family metallopeptidase [Veillonellales bacterium]
MTYPTETPAAKKAAVSEIPTRFTPRRFFLLCVLLLFVAILFVQLYQPPAIAVQAAAANEAASLQAPPPITPKPLASLAATPSIWPAQGTVTSGFGWRISPFGDGNELHPGIDIAYTMGAPVVATADGEVVVSGPAGGYGNLIQIDHKNGIDTLYGHNSQLAVAVGQQVKKGQVIAYAGSTGKSTGPHVHYEVRVNNTPVDPMKYLVLY